MVPAHVKERGSRVTGLFFSFLFSSHCLTRGANVHMFLIAPPRPAVFDVRGGVVQLD